jgi:RimJ/RimL family protein N-acetyltransferase
LTAAPSATPWTLYHILRRLVTDAGRPALIGIAGYVNPPTFDGVVEIGYAIAAEHHRRGYATEAVAALLAHAFAASGVRVVVATTYATLLPSIRVLQKTGFVEVLGTLRRTLGNFSVGRLHRLPCRPTNAEADERSSECARQNRALSFDSFAAWIGR